tara:strand:+ start:5316 stop:5819 length:504 start_codon:yes stop_codon:yes gene_type:complete
MAVRPIPSQASYEVSEMLKKAKNLLEKAGKLDMVEHDGKKVPAFAADGKGAKDEKKKGMGMCPTCGEKKMDMEKGMCMKMGCMGKAADVKKGEHHYAQTYGTKPEHAQFMIESGGQTYNQFYYTNQSLLDSDDVANKGATSHSVDLSALQPNMNPHESPAKGHLTEG